MKNLKMIFRIIIGVVFIASAILKLLSIDHFELYIYSFGFFNFFLTSLLSRLLISAEFILGFFLILKLYYSKTWWLTMFTMIGFTLFLIYTALFRNDANCHCFGSFIEINPVESIIKNGVIIGLLILIQKQKESTFKFSRWIASGIVLVTISLTFIVVPPDALFNKMYSPKSKVNEEALLTILSDSTLQDMNELHGNHMIAIFIPGCKFCKLSIQKFAYIFNQNNLNPNKLKIIVLGDQKGVEKFKIETEIDQFHLYSYQDPIPVIQAVYGSFPTILFLKDQTVIQVINYRGLDENVIINHVRP